MGKLLSEATDFTEGSYGLQETDGGYAEFLEQWNAFYA